jgi:Bax protein
MTDCAAAESTEDLSAKRGIKPRLGGLMLGAVIMTALVLSPAARRASDSFAIGLAEGHGLARLAPQSLSRVFSRTIELPRMDSATSLSRMLTAAGYHFDSVRAGAAEVPRLLVNGLPGDMKTLDSPEERKAVFLQTMLPLVLQVNEDIAGDRARVLDLRDRQAAGQPLSVRDQAWLADLYESYDVSLGNSVELLRRLDVVPVSLALAQAALESGWGTSRFAQEGNALFGQIGPQGSSDPRLLKSAADGTLFRSFDTLMGAVRSYVRNLNTHLAYKEFRSARAGIRKASGEAHALDGLKLVGALKLYSERGDHYLDDLRNLMRANKLRQLDGSRLVGSSTADAAVPANPQPNA